MNEAADLSEQSELLVITWSQNEETSYNSDENSLPTRFRQDSSDHRSRTSVTEVLKTGETLLNFPDSLVTHSDKERIFREIKANYRNFSLLNGLVFLTEKSGTKLPDAKYDDRSIRSIIISS